MFCPRCAKKSDPNTSFCRTCGLSLDEVRGIVTGESASEPEFKYRPNAKIMQIGISIFILGMVVALANAALSTAFGFNKNIGTVVFLSMVAIGMAFLGTGFVFPQKRYAKRRSNFSSKKEEIELETSPLRPELADGLELANDVEFPKDRRARSHAELPSITEHTTRQLK